MKNDFYVLNLAHIDYFIDISNSFENSTYYDVMKNESIKNMIKVMKKGIDTELGITYRLNRNDYDAFNDKYYKIMNEVDSYSDYFQREDVVESIAILDDDIRRQVYLNSSDYDEFKNKLKELEGNKVMKEIVMISDSCIAYSRTDNYQDFEKYYQENASMKEEDARKKLEDRFARHRAYLNASTVDEFRENLESEYGKTSLKSAGNVLTKKK